jgi:hypothetical protein
MLAGATANAVLNADQGGKAMPAMHAMHDMKAIASVKDVMHAITIPASTVVFKAGSDAPADDAGWTAAKYQAIAVGESANLLLVEGRARDSGDWVKLSIAMRDAAVTAVQAIDKKNADALSTASDALYETCDNCHNKYMKK